MKPIHNCIVNNNTTINPIWLMRQAGRYLPEFREIRKSNSNFINLCLNNNLSSKITLQPFLSDKFPLHLPAQLLKGLAQGHEKISNLKPELKNHAFL